MRETLIIIACLSVAIGLRLASSRVAKKLGALVFILTMGFLGFALFQHWISALLASAIWFVIPLLLILWNRRGKLYPLVPTPLVHQNMAAPSFFPHASSYQAQLEDLGFEEIDQASWKWLESEQTHLFFWHPEFYTVASICLCEREKIAFSYIIFYSQFKSGTTVKTTNYPFTSYLLQPHHSIWKHVPCEEKSIPRILENHRATLAQHNTSPCSLLIPDPDQIEQHWKDELSSLVSYNLEKGLISAHGSSFRYKLKGYLYLWAQAVKDIIRLC